MQNTVKGMRNFYPENLFKRKRLFEQFRKTSEKYAFEEYDTCIIENENLYIRKSGDEILRFFYFF